MKARYRYSTYFCKQSNHSQPCIPLNLNTTTKKSYNALNPIYTNKTNLSIQSLLTQKRLVTTNIFKISVHLVYNPHLLLLYFSSYSFF